MDFQAFEASREIMEKMVDLVPLELREITETMILLVLRYTWNGRFKWNARDCWSSWSPWSHWNRWTSRTSRPDGPQGQTGYKESLVPRDLLDLQESQVFIQWFEKSNRQSCTGSFSPVLLDYSSSEF